MNIIRLFSLRFATARNDRCPSLRICPAPLKQSYFKLSKTIIFLILSLFVSSNLYAESFQLKLKQGTNFISIPIGSSWDISQVITSGKKQAAIWDPTAAKYIYYADDPEFNQITKFDYQKGYWVYIEDSQGLSVNLTGSTPITSSIPLKKGWNQIGCPVNNEIPVEEALLPLKMGVDYVSVWRYSSSTSPWYQQYSASVKEFTTLKPGEGYWIKMLKDATWTVDSNRAPIISSITPANGSTILAGAKIDIQAIAISQNTPLKYQFTIGGTIKQAWTTSNTYSWQTSAADTSTVSIKCEVKDSKSQISSKTISISIINPTVQQILQKVADNYAKIRDYKTDMEMSSTLDGKPFAEPAYCRYFYMAPNKEKTETFSDAARTIKTDVIIINNTNMHLIDPVKNIKQTVNLLQDKGITESEYKQGDIYYNLSSFLTQHNIIRNDINSKLDEKLVYIEATPKIKGKLYDKVAFLIDYSKGALSKFQIYQYNENNNLELIQETTTINSKQFTNGAWLPEKMTKTPNLEDHAFISTATYTNLQINMGLTAIDFDPTKQ